MRYPLLCGWAGFVLESRNAVGEVSGSVIVVEMLFEHLVCAVDDHGGNIHFQCEGAVSPVLVFGVRASSVHHKRVHILAHEGESETAAFWNEVYFCHFVLVSVVLSEWCGIRVFAKHFHWNDHPVSWFVFLF